MPTFYDAVYAFVGKVPAGRVVTYGLKGRGTNADLQRELLEEEGVPFNIAGHTDLHAYRWWPGQDGDG